MSTLTSPFSIADVSKAYKAYKAMPCFRREDRTPMPFPAFRKQHKTRHAELTAASAPVREAKGEGNGDLLHMLAELLTQATTSATATAEPERTAENTPDILTALREQMSRANGGGNDGDEGDDGGEFGREDREPDAARNAVLWRLNVEGLLPDALTRAEAEGLDYITQTIGQTILTENFGPLQKRA